MSFHFAADPEDLAYLRVEVTPIESRRVRIVVSGELDRDTAPVLSNAFTETLHTVRPQLIEFDLSELTFVDAAGIRLLLHCHTATASAGARAVLRDPTGPVMAMLDLLDVADHLPIQYG